MSRSSTTVFAAVAVLALTSCASESAPTDSISTNGKDLVAAKILEVWPLTVEEGLLECWPDQSVAFTADDRIYAVNGRARGQLDEHADWADITDIALPGEGINGSTLDLLDFVSYATNFC